MARVKLTAGRTPPICRYCGRPLKPDYHTSYVNPQQAATGSAIYDSKVPVPGEVYRSWKDKIVAVEEISLGIFTDDSRRFKVWLGRWGYGDRFCGPTCAARWALRQP